MPIYNNFVTNVNVSQTTHANVSQIANAMPSNNAPGEMEAYMRSVEDRFNAAMQQQRTQHVDDIRLLVEKYTYQKIELLRERDAIQEAREEEAAEAQEAYDDLEREKMDLEEENEEREELEELQRIKNDLEKEKRMMKKEFKRQTEVWQAEKKEWEAGKARQIRRMQALEEEARMLKAKTSSLERKVSRMEARATAANREHVKTSADHVYWQRQYRAALAERNEWLQRYAPPPTLSTETLTTIAAFVSGNNDFKTLASMSLMSKQMAQEIKPMLWETVVWTDALATRFKAGEAAGEYPEEFQHIKFVVVPSRLWDPKIEDDCLPNLQAMMIQNLHPAEAFPDDEAPPRHTIKLRVLRNTTCATLSSILKSHLDWRRLATGPPKQHRVAGISDVFIHGEATLSLGDGMPNAMFKPTATHARQIHLEKSREQGEAGDIRLDASIRSLCELVLPQSTDRVILQRPRLAIRCDDSATLLAWLQELPSWINRNCDLSPTLTLSFDRAITEHEFLLYARNVSETYKILWADKFQLREHMRERLVQGNQHFDSKIFRMEAYPPNNDGLASFAAVFTKEKGQEGFHVRVEKYASLEVKYELDDGRAYDVILLEDRQEEPVLRRLGSRSVKQESADDSDSSTDESDSSSDDSDSDSRSVKQENKDDSDSDSRSVKQESTDDSDSYLSDLSEEEE